MIDKVKKKLSDGFVGMKVKESGAKKKGKTLARRALISKSRVRIRTT